MAHRLTMTNVSSPAVRLRRRLDRHFVDSCNPGHKFRFGDLKGAGEQLAYRPADGVNRGISTVAGYIFLMQDRVLALHAYPLG